MSARMPLAAITAAGASSRMGRPKALLPWNGRPLLAHMVATLRGAGLGRIAVITGAGRESIEPVAAELGTEVVHNPKHATGRFSSVRAAARWAGRQPLLLWPVDCPAVSETTVRALLDASAQQPEAAVAPRCQERGGHPVVLPPAVVQAVISTDADGNLRELLRAAPGGRVSVPVDDHAVLDNLNTPLDYRRFLESRPLPPTTVAVAGADHG